MLRKSTKQEPNVTMGADELHPAKRIKTPSNLDSMQQKNTQPNKLQKFVERTKTTVSDPEMISVFQEEDISSLRNSCNNSLIKVSKFFVYEQCLSISICIQMLQIFYFLTP